MSLYAQQFLYKPVDNFDLSLNITEQDPRNNSGFMSVDQTFHTPSFGDEEFEIPPLSLAPTSIRSGSGSDVFTGQIPVEYLKRRLNGGQIYVYLPHHNNNSGCRTCNDHPLSHQQPQNSPLNHPSCQQSLRANNLASNSSPQNNMMDNSHAQYQSPPQSGGSLSPHQDMYRPSGEMIAPHSMHMQMQSYDVRTTYSNAPIQQQQQQQQAPMQPPQMNMMQQQPPQGSHVGSMGPPQQQPMFSTISQSQLSSQLGLQIGMGPSPHQGPGSVGSSPPGSNHNSPGLETSEDSDDSTPLAQLIGGMKRPSPEPTDTSVSKNTKKPKAQKKKKKRDPNEPQKPVSAYALFFRDTQAAIKGQNPNASFGEVSKIVASMWDSLDAEHKNVYKKKTEAAKKEYLKALAAYRATLVSKAAVDHSDTMYGTTVMGSASPPATSSASNSPPGHVLSPVQKKAPMLTPLMDTVPPVTNMASHQPSVVSSQVWAMQQPQQHLMSNSPPHMMHTNQMAPVHPQQLQSHMIQQQRSSPAQMPMMGNRPQVTQISAVPPQLSHSASNSPTYPQNMSPVSMAGSHQNIGGGENMMAPLQNCLRNGCPNPAVDSPDWDREYCSSECVVSHCRDVFTAWVASRQATNTYASVK